MNEESFLTDFQFQFESPHTPPQQPHNNNIPHNLDTPNPSSSSSSEGEDGHPIHIVPLDNPLINMAQAAVSGGQLSSITQYSGNQGLEGLVYAEAIDLSLIHI